MTYVDQSKFFLFVSIFLYSLLLYICLRQKIGGWKIVFLTFFYVYLAGVVLVTLLPIPPRLTSDMALSRESELLNNIIPFATMMRVSHRSLYVASINIGGNILLTVPLGFFIFLFGQRKPFIRACLIGLLFSVCIELAQFLISRFVGFSYRSTDIDDVLLNLVGFILGYVLFKVCRLLVTKLRALL
jgi:glycopeptide antibiotics resistance protein